MIYRMSILLLLLLMASVTAQNPGLYYDDGTAHPVHAPNPVTGSTLNVLDFGADPADNENDDRPAIEAALDAATLGDEIYFPNGTYNLMSGADNDNNSNLIMKNGVNLRGESRGGTILISGFNNPAISTRVLKMKEHHDILISNLTISSIFDGQYSTNTQVNNPEAGGPRYVISIEGNSGYPSYNITVDSVLVEKYRVHGVRLSNSRDVVIKNSIFRNATDVGGGGAGYGVSVQGDGKYDNESKFNVVETCQFLGPYMRHGVLLQYATHNNEVRNNLLIDNRLDAIDLHGEDEYLNEIYKNEVRDVTTGAGVGVGNTGSTHDASGPFNYIHHNTMINCREGVKVYLGSPDTRIEDNIVKNSTVANGKGVYILNGPRTIIRGNKIFENSGASFTGIYLQYDGGTNGVGKGNPEDIWIAENEIYQNDYGVRIYNGERIVVENNNIYDNRNQDFYSSVPTDVYRRLFARATGYGFVETEPAGVSFVKNSTVILLAKRGANWQFSHWEGDLSGAAEIDSLLMESSKEVIAVFEPNIGSDETDLTVRISGNGNVRFDPPGGVYERGTVVTLTAISDSGWLFSGWSGDLNSAAVIDSIIMDNDKSILAVFAPQKNYQLTAWIMGSGQVLFDPPGGSYAPGTVVTLTAVPDNGWEFSHWQGALTGSNNPDSVIVSGDMIFIAQFVETTSVGEIENKPYDYRLEQNYPNPFNASTMIRYSLREPTFVSLSIHNLKGEVVRDLVNGHQNEGEHSVLWNGNDDAGRLLTSGMYIYKLRVAGFSFSRKLLLLK